DGDGASPAGPVPTFSALQPWLEKIKNPALACTTAQRVAASMTRDEDRLEALQAAIGHAVTAAGSLDDVDQGQDEQHPENRPRSLLTLLPLPSLAAEGTANNKQDPATKAGARAEVEEEMEEGGGEVEAEVVVDRLQRRALRLEHLMTAKACVGADMAERLSPFLLSGSTELLTELLVVAAEGAADAALALPPTSGEGCHHHSAAAEWMTATTTGGGSSSSSTAAEVFAVAGVGGGNMSDFRRRATGALQAARSVADQRGMDPHDVETIIFRLAKNWICQHKLGGGAGSTGGHGGAPAAVAGERDAGMFVGAGLAGGGGGGGESVFVKDAREERMLEDATLALRAAFVLTVTFSDDAVDGDTSVCDSIAFMDLKSRISVLLSIAKDGRRDGRSNRVKFRARLRALLALSALAPPTLVAEVMASDKEKEGWDAQGEGLSSLSDFRRNIGYMSELEEARLPHKLEEVASCPAEDIVRALRRDHRQDTQREGGRSLIPLMCDMLLDARSGDVGLWSPILADACRHDELRRVLIMRVFPRVVRSSVAEAFARSGATLAASWEEVLRSPLEELMARQERRRKKEAAAAARGPPGGATAAAAFPGASSTSFGASLFAMTSGRNGGAGGGALGRGGSGATAGQAPAAAAGGGGGSGECPHEDVNAVVEQVVLLLGACPFPERMNLKWFYSTLADLGPRFHAQAVQIALGVSGPTARTTAVLELLGKPGNGGGGGGGGGGGVALNMVLDELQPVAAGGGSGVWGGTANQVIVEAIFVWIDERRGWAELHGTRHFDAMVSTLVRAGRARGMVAASLAAGKHQEAYSLCQMHYAAAAAVVANGIEHGRGGGAAATAAAGTGGGCRNSLERFAKEFGLKLPPV
ncbi:unnamed protein product, partial [Ectocarpus sp. 12 AP-2014]